MTHVIVTHPEDYCHRCLGRNLVWHMDNEVWNAVMRDDGPDAPWKWNEIICPQCFAELFEAKFGGVALLVTIDFSTVGARAYAAEKSVTCAVCGMTDRDKGHDRETIDRWTDYHDRHCTPFVAERLSALPKEEK